MDRQKSRIVVLVVCALAALGTGSYLVLGRTAGNAAQGTGRGEAGARRQPTVMDDEEKPGGNRRSVAEKRDRDGGTSTPVVERKGRVKPEPKRNQRRRAEGGRERQETKKIELPGL